MRIPPLFAFAACTFIWGTTWLAIKIGYGGLDAVWGASLRFLLAGIILLPIVVVRRIALPANRRQWFAALFTGTVLFGLDYGLIYWGEQFLTSGLTAILFATMPLFVTLFAVILIPQERMTSLHAAGVAVGLAGLVVIFFPDLRAGVSAVGPAVAIVVSAIAAGSASVVVRRWGRDIPPMSLNATAMLTGAVLLAAASLLMGERPGLPATSGAWIALLYLVFLGSIVSFFLYWDLLRQWPAHRAGLIPILTPVVAVVTGLFLNERLTTLQWMGSIIVLLGVALSLVPSTPRAAPAPDLAAPPIK